MNNYSNFGFYKEFMDKNILEKFSVDAETSTSIDDKNFL